MADEGRKEREQGLKGFVFFWGWVFLITTTLVLVFKKEVDHSITPSSPDEGEELELGIVDTYAVLWKIVRLKPMLWLLIVLLTGKRVLDEVDWGREMGTERGKRGGEIAFAATDGITGLKLIGMGMPKDKLSSMAVFLTPLQVLLPWMIGKYTAGPRPLNVFLLAYPYRIFMGGVFAALVWWTPSFRLPGGDFPLMLYAIWVAGYCFHQVASYCMFVSMMAFNAQISDPKIGGTYMTLLNTLNNLGGNWPVTLILSLTDYFTFKDCVVKNTKTRIFHTAIIVGMGNCPGRGSFLCKEEGEGESIRDRTTEHRVLYSCNTKALMDQCTKGGDVCEVHIDGYYIAVALCSVIGIVWFKTLFSKIKYFQKIPRSEWSVIKK
uniref:Acetyl-coenzyme A transporter 1 n=1 Tax=Ascaris lumbricoides TaxID=6252 RepID=A0A9J2PU26_ASCLU